MNAKLLQEALYIADLIKRQRKGLDTVDDATELENWLTADARNKLLYDRLQNSDSLLVELQKMSGYDSARRIEDVLQKIGTRSNGGDVHSGGQADETVVVPVTAPRQGRWLPWAAAVLLMIGAGLTILLLQLPKEEKMIVAARQDAAPGGNKAMLTLGDGTRIALDSAGNGALALQGNVQVLKLNSGQLAYHDDNTTGSGQIQFNTLSTPRGGQYQLTLPDGTRVWLNAASSLRYPTRFTGKERRVEVKGEAYFEVVKNTGMPFRVTLPEDGEIVVTGTHFNVNAYTDEPFIKATLLEGGVRVSKKGKTARLEPGQQAQIPFGAGISEISVVLVDMEEATAWKNGLFRFNNADLPTVMRQLSRWYDVDVSYEGKIPSRKFEGEIQRNLHLSDVMEALGKNRVHFRIEGKKIILTP